MSFTPISQCAKTLDFGPRRSWPQALPAMCWKGKLIVGFDRIGGPAVDLFSTQDSSFPEAFVACHPTLGLGELTRLIEVLRRSEPSLFESSVESILATYGLRWSERLANTFEKIIATPREFHDWLDDKSCGARDLASLLAVGDLSALRPFFVSFSQTNLSKSQGVQALEHVIDLYLLNFPIADLMPANDKPEKWLAHLQALRKPVSTTRDLIERENVSKLPWPSFVQAQWVRNGDDSGLEIKLRVRTPDDLGTKLEKLTSLGDAWRFLKN